MNNVEAITIISLVSELENRIEISSKMFHDSTVWSEEEHYDGGKTYQEWIDEAFMAINKYAMDSVKEEL